MAGTDSTKADTDWSDPAQGPGVGPAIILVQPQLGENIGMCARAMWNCGLTDLRLVRPRDGWPNRHALAAASGADDVIGGARLFDSTADAIADLHYLVATTARPRDMTKRLVTPAAAAAELRRHGNRQRVTTGVLFGRESRGLHNDDVALADVVLHVPLNPAFSSLNIAQAVLLIAYAWLQTADDAPGAATEIAHPADTRPADKAEMMGLFEHLESELDDCGFLRVPEKRPTMVRNIRNIFGRADLTEQEVRTLRGIISGLSTKRRR